MGKVKVIKTSMEQPEVKSLEPGRATGVGLGPSKMVKSEESKKSGDSKKKSSTRGTKKSGVPAIQTSKLIGASPLKSPSKTSGNGGTKTKSPPKKSGVKSTVVVKSGVKRASSSVSSAAPRKKVAAKATAPTKTIETKVKAGAPTKAPKTKAKAKVLTKTLKAKAKTATKKKSNSQRRWVFWPDDFGPLYQFKIELIGSNPLIWRQIQVPVNYNFLRLHLAIKSAMGWNSRHAHCFEMYDGTRIGTPSTIPEVEAMNPVLDEEEELIARRFDLAHEFNNRIMYEYDFGDEWKHMITLERTLQAVPKKLYPVCVAGERACPPEDVGGLDGYERFLKIMENKKHEEYEDMKAWADDCGWGGHPNRFNPAECEFAYC